MKIIFFKNKPGTVLIFTLLILSVIAVLTQQLVRSVMVGSVFNQTMISREKAEMLAFGGINLAMHQLTQKPDKDKKTGEPLSEEEKTKNFKQWLLTLLSNLNRWQIFELKEEFDGVDGQIKICISSEHGKININQAFDFEIQEFKKEYDFLLKGLEIKGSLPAGQVYNKIIEHFKTRKRKLDDISELLNISELGVLDIFYEPPPKSFPGKKSQPNTTIVLQDLFTIWTADEKIDPLLLSDSMCSVFDLRRPKADDAEKLKEAFKKIIDEFKKDWGKNWDENWKFLLPIYDKKPKILNNINKILFQEFGPQVYSVLSCGRVGNVEQKLLAILKKREDQKDKPAEKKPEEKTSSKVSQSETKKIKDSKAFRVVKIYWL